MNPVPEERRETPRGDPLMPQDMDVKEILCEVCNERVSVGVASVPGVPVSCAYCEACLKANAHPWGILVANTALIGGLEGKAADWWMEMVECTCAHLKRPRSEFDRDVKKAMAMMADDDGPAYEDGTA